MLILNFCLVSLIVISFVFYFYFKTKQFRTPLPIHKLWYQNRAGRSLSIMLILFGVNQIFIHVSLLTIIVCSLFIILGAFTFIGYTKRASYYGHYVEEELPLS